MFKILKTFAVLLAALPASLAAQEDAVIRLNSTIQPYSAGQPWDKVDPRTRRGLVTYIEGGYVITTAEMVADAAFMELETVDGNHRIPAKVKAIDYEANLAILVGASDADKAKLASVLKPVAVAKSSKVGNKVNIMQVEASGRPLKTEGVIQGGAIVSSFVSGNFFLNYTIKASMQSAASSYTIPVFEDGKLLGVLTSYSSKDQILEVLAPEIINAFLLDAKDGEYLGFPKAGIGTTKTTDPHFRSWLKLSDDVGGLYITAVSRKSAAEKAGIKKGDVLLAVEGKHIDSQGYFKSDKFGKLHWSHLVRAMNKMGDEITLLIQREGKKIEKKVKLTPMPEGVIPSHMYDRAPNYLVKGGIVFQELSGGYMKVFGKEWKSRAPLSLLDVYNHPEDYEEGRNRVVFISAVIPTPATLGYERVRSVVVEKVNGKVIADVASLIEAFKHPKDGIHKIEIAEDPKELFLSEESASQIDKALLQRGLPSLSRK